MLKQEIDKAINQYHVQPVGNGYIDCICPTINVIAFIDKMSEIGVRITGFSWWCHVTKGHLACGMGGPKDKYGDGWYSEINMSKTYDFVSNDEIKEYLNSVWMKSKDCKPCYVPAFYLDVPDEWKNNATVDM